MIIADFHRIFPVTKAEDVPAGSTAKAIYKKSIRYAYLVSASTPEELQRFIDSRVDQHGVNNCAFDTVQIEGKPAPTGKPIYYSSDLHTDGWIELQFSSKGFLFASDERALAHQGAIQKATEQEQVELARMSAESKRRAIDELFPKKSRPVFTQAANTPTAPPTGVVDGKLDADKPAG